MICPNLSRAQEVHLTAQTDVVVEIQFEEFVADPIGAIIDIDLQDIKISEIGADLTTDQKEKAQEVIVPTILVRVASLALLRREV